MEAQEHEAVDPDYKQRVQDSFNRQGFMHHIGAELGIIKPGYCEIRVPYAKALAQQHGFFHAGVMATVADNTAGYAAYSLMAADSSILTVEFKINFVAPAEGDVLVGKASVKKAGRTLVVCQSEVYVREGNAEKLCAVTQATLMELKQRSDQPVNNK